MYLFLICIACIHILSFQYAKTFSATAYNRWSISISCCSQVKPCKVRQLAVVIKPSSYWVRTEKDSNIWRCPSTLRIFDAAIHYGEVRGFHEHMNIRNWKSSCFVTWSQKRTYEGSELLSLLRRIFEHPLHTPKASKRRQIVVRLIWTRARLQWKFLVWIYWER